MKKGFHGFRVERDTFTCRLLGFHLLLSVETLGPIHTQHGTADRRWPFWEKVLEVELQRAPGSATRCGPCQPVPSVWADVGGADLLSISHSS